jgi:2-methylcitrate dehydratase
MDKVEERLIAFVGSFNFRDLESEVLHAIKRRFIDTIGCALGAFHVETSRIARNIASRVESSAKAGVIGTRAKSSPDLAAFANTAMIRCLDLNDDYFGKDGPHPSDTIGAVLAVGDSTHADGKTVVNAIAVAYEILCSFADAVGLRERGWDYVTIYCSRSGPGCRQGAQLAGRETQTLPESSGGLQQCVGSNTPRGAVDVERIGIGQRLSKWRFRRNARRRRCDGAWLLF